MKRALAAIVVVVAMVLAYVGWKPKTMSVLWSGDPAAVGSEIFVNGKFLTRLTGTRRREVWVEQGASPCYERGDTIAAIGVPTVGEYVEMPLGRLHVLVRSPRGVTLECDADIVDSPGFSVYMKCGYMWYPHGSGSDSVTAHPR